MIRVRSKQDRNLTISRGETGFTYKSTIKLTEDKNLWHFRTTQILGSVLVEGPQGTPPPPKSVRIEFVLEVWIYGRKELKMIFGSLYL